MQTKKVILFLVEGISDQTTLGLILSKLIRDSTVGFHIVGGDITSNRYTTLSNALEKVNEEVKKFLDRNKFRITDISQIIHIVDIDGAYVSNEDIVEDSTVSRFVYKDNVIVGKNADIIRRRNEKKASILDKLSNTHKVRKIPYRLFYFSLNLEHVIHNIRDAKDSEKDSMAEQFADRFYGQEREFIEFIQNHDFAVDGDYKETWEFIKERNHSLNRYSNFHLYFME